MNESTGVNVSVKKERKIKEEWPKKSKRVLFVYAECSHKMGRQTGACIKLSKGRWCQKRRRCYIPTKGFSHTSDEKEGGMAERGVRSDRRGDG